VKRTPLRKVSSRKSKELRLEKLTREIVLERSNYKCEACLVRGLPQQAATDKHERIMRSMGGNPTDPENCLAVCNGCHRWLHDNPTDATKLGLLKSNNQPFGWRLYDERTCETKDGE